MINFQFLKLVVKSVDEKNFFGPCLKNDLDKFDGCSNEHLPKSDQIRFK